MQSKNYSNIADTIKGEINRICVTDDINELNSMLNYAVNNIYKLFSIRYDDLKNRQEENKLESEHGECEGCAFELLPEFNYPCNECQNNYISHWRAKDD